MPTVKKIVETAGEVSKAVSNDIAVFRTRFDVETGKGRKRVLTPVEAELHINPVSIAVAAAAALLGTLAGTIAWHGINVPAPLGGAIELMPGIKDTDFGKDVNAWYQRRKIAVIQKEQDKLRADLEADDDECKRLHQDLQRASRRGDSEAEAEARRKARERGCRWSQ